MAVAFDVRFYRTVYPDIPFDMDALGHYRSAGWREPRDPAPWFSVEHYLTDHPDVAASDRDPFEHYLRVGRFEGRDVAPSRHAGQFFAATGWSLPPPRDRGMADHHDILRGPASALSLADQRAAIEAEFDVAYYRALNPDVAAAGIDPVEHFLQTGWREGRDPSPRFSVRDYLEANPDIRAAGVNPFVHYKLAGEAEGRSPRLSLGFRYEVLSRATPVAERLSKARVAAARRHPDPPERLAEALSDLKSFHITFSHDDYVRHGGGLQFCVRRESATFQAAGMDHLHLFPPVAWPMVRLPTEPGALGVLLNGRNLGVFTPEAVAAALSQRRRKPAHRSFAIHSLLGHDADATADILAAASLRSGAFWLHDFASLCAGFHLLRNDVEDCAAPPADSPACGICDYGPFRSRHLAAHRRLFERLELTVVAPSRATLDFWQARTDLPAATAVVLPHATLAPRAGVRHRRKSGPLRVAYLGMPTALKGWPIFRDLAIRFADDPRYAFHHLGGQADPSAPAVFHPVTVSAEHPTAMRDAVEALGIDAALIWPLCRETFSFTAYEAAAGGARILAGPDSGNVAVFAAEPDRGTVFADEAALTAAFETGAVRGADRRATFDLVYSGMTADLIPGINP